MLFRYSMKKVVFTLILSLLFLSLSAQDFEIVSVESLPADMSAREEMKTDHNDRQCALLRIATQNITPEQREGFTFKPDLGSEIVDRANRNGEILLWVSPGLKYLLIMHRDWGQYELRLPDYVARIEALHTYKVTIKGTFIVAPQAQSEVSPTQQYLVFQLTPPNATLEVDDQLWSVDADGTAMKYVNFGTYTYRVRASDYYTETGKVTVDDPNNTKIVPVSLKPNFATITLKVDADAEIWVNNVKKGIRSWTGPLGNGTYKIECKQSGHETTMISKEVTIDMNGQIITLPTPTPIYGSLNMESTPNLATIFIDGKEVGKTPKAISEILVGEHEIRLSKDGYADYIEMVTITRGERSQIKTTMIVGNNTSISENSVGVINGHEYVDLGLPSGTLWATCNIGAVVPEGYGSYFAWGETEPKANYDWSTYKYSVGNRLTKYCTNGRYGYQGYVDKLTTLQSGDDIATENWGDGWCVPTKAMWEELYNNTNKTWTIRNGVKGALFTGENGNSIFLPATGGQWGNKTSYVGNGGYYWSSSLYTKRSSDSWLFYFGPDQYGIDGSLRNIGRSVRAVLKR